MRVNIYAEEMPDEPRLEIIEKEIEGHKFTALRIYLELPATVDGKQYQGPFMHRPGDDDSSAVTFWGKRDLRVTLRRALAMLDQHYERRMPDAGDANDPLRNNPVVGFMSEAQAEGILAEMRGSS
jgi:hypothetical protein